MSEAWGGRVFEGLSPTQILADQLTVSQPGEQIMPTSYYTPPPPTQYTHTHFFRPSDIPAYVVLLTRLLKPHLVVYALKNKHTLKRPCSTTCVFDLVSPTVKEE